MPRKPSPEETWRDALTGEMAGLKRVQSIFKRIPSDPRCKLCYAPFGKPGSLLIHVLGGKPAVFFEHRVLDLRGREQSVEAWVQPFAATATSAA
jgi:hypothetical protein